MCTSMGLQWNLSIILNNIVMTTEIVLVEEVLKYPLFLG